MQVLLLCEIPEVHAFRFAEAGKSKIQRHRLGRPPWFLERLQRAGLPDYVLPPKIQQPQRPSRGHKACALACVAPGSCYGGPLHSWSHFDECELQWAAYRRPLDACSLQVQRLWTFDTPLVIRFVGSASDGGMTEAQTYRNPLFYPVLPPDAYDAAMHSPEGQPCTLHEALKMVAPEVLQQGGQRAFGRLALTVSAPILQLLLRGPRL